MNKLYLILLIFALSSCELFIGSEVGRASISSITTENNIEKKSIELQLEKYDEIHFWTEMDIQYKNQANVRFLVNMYKDGELDEEFMINPFEKDLTINDEKTEENGTTHWKFEGRSMIINVQEDGQYTIEVILTTLGEEPIELLKSDLVIRM